MSSDGQLVYIVDDDPAVLDSMSMLLESVNLEYRCFRSALEFLESCDGSESGCLLLDIRMPGMNGLELQRALHEKHSVLPIIFMTGHGDIPMAVAAMREGALDFMRKPVRESDLLERISEAMNMEQHLRDKTREKRKQLSLLSQLTPREREVFDRVAQGQANKVIGFDLGISERTVEVHRSQVMKKLKARTLADLVRISLEIENDR